MIKSLVSYLQLFLFTSDPSVKFAPIEMSIIYNCFLLFTSPLVQCLLKGRWNILNGFRERSLPLVSDAIVCCAVLHNILESRREKYEVSLSRAIYILPSFPIKIRKGLKKVRGQKTICSHTIWYSTMGAMTTLTGG